MTALYETQNIVLLMIFPTVIILAACSSTPSLEIESSTSTLDEFAPIDNHPSNSFLFLAADYRETCTKTCNCIQLEEIRPSYRFDGHTLFLVKWFLDDLTENENWEEYKSKNQAIGLYSYWQPDDAILTTIKFLPYQLENTDFSIEAIDSKGNVSTKINFSRFVLETKKMAMYEWTESKSRNCQITYTYNVANFGFINDTQVVIEE